MRSLRRLGPTLGVLFIAGCVMPGGGSPSSHYDAVSAPKPRPGTRAWQEVSDSIQAQAIADREGPGVSLHVEFYNVSDTRRAAVGFHVDDDAYVVVGHIDADGVVRIAFPTNPLDDGFVKGGRSYRTPEFFAGFLAEFRTRYNQMYQYRGVSSNFNSYDGGLGYAFVIASWRPMHFDKFSTNGEWYTFELADQNYLSDPRPAIYELASLLAGDNREAYTVKFARYSSTEQLNSGYSNFASSSYSFCAGASPFGFASSPFSTYGVLAAGAYWGEDFSYRGSRYYYDGAGDCYRQGFYGGGFQGYAYGPGVGQPSNPNTPARIFDIEKGRSHPVPKELPGYKLPVSAVGGGTGTTDAAPAVVHTSPQYRDRGLITNDEPSNGGPIRRGARTGSNPVDDHSRPSIQQMINRRDQNANDGSSDGWARAQNSSNRGRSTSDPSTSTPRNSGGDNQARQRPVSGDNSGRSPETRSAPASSAPRSAPAPSSPPPSAPAPARAPSPPPPAPSSSGSSGSSSSGSGSPVKPPAQ